jgi:N-acetylmuramoyl-L-alanine amidase
MANHVDMIVSRKINQIVVHCSDSNFGGWQLIDHWHKNRGWDGIGYHYVICNAYPTHNYKRPYPSRDGRIQYGRGANEIGAHAKGHNSHSIGICLIGTRYFTGNQIDSLIMVIDDLQRKFPDIESVVGHCELPDVHKDCPNLDMDYIRRLIA